MAGRSKARPQPLTPPLFLFLILILILIFPTLLLVSYTQLARRPHGWARDMITHLGIHTPWDERELMRRPLPSRQARTPLRSRVSGLADDVLAELSTHPRYRLGLGCVG